MLSTKIKKTIAFILSLMMVLSSMPSTAFATEADTHDHDHEADSLVVSEENVAPQDSETVDSETVNPTVTEFQDRIDTILKTYLGSPNISAEEVPALVERLDDYTCEEAYWEILILDEDIMFAQEDGLLADVDLEELYNANLTMVAFADAVIPRVETTIPTISFFTTTTVLDGQVSISDTANSNTVSGGTVTIKAEGSLISKKTNTITITNSTDNQASLSFDYSASTYNSFTIAGASAAASGSYTVLLDAGGSLTIVLVSNSGLSNKTATLTLSNFSLTVAAASSNVTINYDSSLGSVTAGGSAVDSGTTQEVSLTDGIALTATAASDASFIGWIDADGKILSTATTYTLNPPADMTVKAVFIGSNSAPHFYVGSSTQKSQSSGLLGMSKLYYYTVGASYLFDDLNTAAAKAAADSTSKVVTLANNSTLAAGTYTIPAGVTLLIPFDSANTMYTTQIQNTGTYTTPTAYRTLTLADGANIVINGAMSISAKQRYAQGSKTDGGSPTGECAFVKMQGSSKITVNNGGALYAYGFITGSGSVTVNSGATVHEMFQFMDFRGGTQTTDSSMDTNNVFPLSQYYVQNIEVPMTIHSGATEYANTAIYMSSADFFQSIAFIGSGGMFLLNDGSYAVKKYDGSTDRLIIDLYGDASLSNINMKVGSSDAIDSADFTLPLNSNITVNIHSGTATISQDISLLPGSIVTVAEGASAKVASGNKVIAYDRDDWIGGGYCAPAGVDFIPISYAPGKTYTRTEADLVDAKIVINGTVYGTEGALYTTAGGAEVISEGNGAIKTTAGAETVTHELNQATATYADISIVPAKLKNADGTYVETSGATVATTYEYCATHGKWYTGECADCAACEHTYDNDCDADCNLCGATRTPSDHVPGAAATCVTAQTCTVCGTELNSATGVHSYTVEQSKTVATCYQDGSVVKKCATCTATTTETLKATGNHDFGGDYITENGQHWQKCTTTGCIAISDKVNCSGGTATCTAEPVCDVCKVSYGSMLEHTYNQEKAEAQYLKTAATCKAKAVYYKSCTCGAFDTAKSETFESGTLADHSYGDWVETKTATCKEAGSKQKTCGVCGNVVTEEIPKLTTHTWVDADCDTPKTCSACGATEGAALGHNIVLDTNKGTEGYTWAEDGSTCTAYGDCTRCDHTVDVSATVNSEVTKTATCNVKGETTYTATFGDNAKWASTQTKVLENVDMDSSAHDPNTESWESDGTNHWHACNNGCGTHLDETAHTTATRNDNVVGATCSKEGSYDLVTYCSVCNHVISTEHKTTENTSHNYEAVVTAPTCTEQGYTTHTCSACGDSYVDTYVDANGHSFGEWTEREAPTCTEKGEKRRDCTNCDHYETQEVAANGHTEAIDAAVAATCTETGLTEGKHCSACGDVLVTQETVDALGHTEGEATQDGYVAPTCTEKGSYESVVKCSVCGEELSRTTVEISATDHKADETNPHICASCKQPISTCGVKNPEYRGGSLTLNMVDLEVLKVTNYYTKIGVGSMLARVDKVTDLAQELNSEFFTRLFSSEEFEMFVAEIGLGDAEPTEEQAYNLAVLYAAKNMAEMDAGTVTAIFTDPNGKTNLKNNIKTAGSEKIGLVQAALVYGLFTTYTNNESDALDDANIILNAFDYPEFLAFVESKEGQIEIQGYLAAMRMVRDSLNPSVATALMQNGFADEELANVLSDALATEEPNHECDICGNGIGSCTYYTEEITKEASCKEEGVKTYTCIVCKEVDTTKTETLETLPHSYGEGKITTAPGCLTTGVETYTCSACSDTKTETVPATGHKLKEHVAVEPTCVNAGNTLYYSCENGCGHYFSDANGEHEIDNGSWVEKATGIHSFTTYESNNDATCKTDGTKTAKCDNCNETHTITDEGSKENVDHTPADAVVENNVDPDCTNAGSYDNVVYCSVCNAEMSCETVTVAALGHTWNDGEVTTAATCTDAGVKTYTCTVETCGETKTEEIAIDSTKHTVTEETEWQSDETNHWKLCPGCGESVDTEAHSFTDGVCGVCGSVEAVRVTIVDTGNSLVLDGAISIRQFIVFKDLDMTQEEILKNGGMEITKENGTTYTVPLSYSGVYKGNKEYVAVTEGIGSLYMGDTMTFRPFIIINGEPVYGEAKEMSVRIWAENKIKNGGSEKLKSTMVALLNYGAEAQKYKKYKTDNLMNASLQSFVDQGYLNASYLEENWTNDLLNPVVNPVESMTVNFVNTETLSISGRTLVLDGAISLTYYVNIGKDATLFKDAKDAKFYFWTSADYQRYLAAGEPLTQENASFSCDAELQYSQSYGYEFMGLSNQIASIYLGDTVYTAFSVTDANGTIHSIGVDPYSAEAYSDYKINDNNPNAQIDAVCKWLVIYGERAKDYLSSL